MSNPNRGGVEEGEVHVEDRPMTEPAKAAHPTEGEPANLEVQNNLIPKGEEKDRELSGGRYRLKALSLMAMKM